MLHFTQPLQGNRISAISVINSHPDFKFSSVQFNRNVVSPGPLAERRENFVRAGHEPELRPDVDLVGMASGEIKEACELKKDLLADFEVSDAVIFSLADYMQLDMKMECVACMYRRK